MFKMKKALMHRFSIAPMMDWTDRPCRTFLRLLTRHGVLYTEMLHARAVVHGNRQKLLRFPDIQHPLVLQLGGSDPEILAEAARIGEGFGYDEINLNVGCPSDRVQAGQFGASLMKDPHLTADLVAAMRRAVAIPVTVKCRIGVDDQDSQGDFDRFIDIVAAAGCEHFIVHARKAWLQGLSPKQNREVPPLDHDRVDRLKARRPDLLITINGGIVDLQQSLWHLARVDGVMMGRAAYGNPWMLSHVDRQIHGDPRPLATRAQIVERMIPFIEQEMAQGMRLHQIARHMIGLYQGEKGARLWRRLISVETCRDGAGPEVLLRAMSRVEGMRERGA